MSNEELFDKLKRLYPDFSKGHKKIADVIFESWESIAFISPREIGERLGVSETTVIRFAKELGYNSYSEFREYVRGLIKLKLTPAEKMISSIQKLQKSHEGFLNKVFAEEMENFKNGITKVSSQDFFKAVELIENAKRVFIIGFGVSASLCYFLEFRFQRMQIDTHILTHGDKYFFEHLLLAQPNDVFIGIGFFRCAQEILYAFDFAREQKINTIAVTHSAVSELAERATVTLVANRGPVSQTNSLAMPMTILNALVISLAEKEGSKGLNALKKLDQFKNHLSKTNLDYNKKG